MTDAKRFTLMLRVVLIILFSIFAAYGAAGDIDSSFNSYTTIINGLNLPSAYVKASVLQPDGKLLICGSFTVVGGFARKNIARLNADGTVDTTFNPPEIDLSFILPTNIRTSSTASGIGLQSDGKILLGGDFNYVNGQFLPRLIRLNPDGSPDTAFNNIFHQDLSQFEGFFYDIKILPNGKILLAGDFGFLKQNTVRIFGGLVRINSDGSYDNTFVETLNSSGWMKLRKIQPLPDGRIMVGGSGSISFNNVGLARLNSDGTIDFSFSGVHVNGTVYDFEILGNGQTLIVGVFSTVNGFTQGKISRINMDGTLDTNFNANNVGADQSITTIKMAANGKMLIGGGFTTFNTVSKNRMARLNADASVDNSFNYTQTNNGNINTINIFPNGNIFVGGETGTWDNVAILNDSGVLQTGNYLVGTRGIINSIVQQSDGKILVGGRFETANGVKRSNVARFNLDGTLDTAFNSNNLATTLTVSRFSLQPDGKILLATSPSNVLVRLNTDGTVDSGFTAFAFGNLQDSLVQSDGKIIAVGDFNSGRKIFRFNANGTDDNSFNNISIDGLIERIIRQPDGKLLIAGAFTSVAGNNRGRIARLNADGTFDSSFNPFGGANNTIYDMALQTDGKIVVVGDFTGLNGGISPQYVGRFNSDGSLDNTFNQAANSPVYAVSLQTDGKIIIGGTMMTVGGVSRSGIARLNSNGALDSTFQIGTGTNNAVWSVAIQSDGKILAGGEFIKYNGVSKVSLVRLLNTAAPLRSLFDYDGDGKADVSVFRASENKWYILQSSDFAVVQKVFAIANDVAAPADYDGDGKTDVAIFRPSTGDWWYQSSINNAQIPTHWGQAGDIPRPSDFDGDGKADFIVYRPSNSVWYRFGSTGAVSILAFGIAEDKPLVGDFDGDGKSDFAIFRPSTGDWWYAASSAGGQFRATHWGASGDIPVPADYDGDGKTDFAVFRPSNGGWYISNSSNGSFTILSFGLSSDKPVAADYDGDGRSDIAVFRPSTGTWYLMQTTAGFGALQFGVATDIPTENAFLP